MKTNNKHNYREVAFPSLNRVTANSGEFVETSQKCSDLHNTLAHYELQVEIVALELIYRSINGWDSESSLEGKLDYFMELHRIPPWEMVRILKAFLGTHQEYLEDVVQIMNGNEVEAKLKPKEIRKLLSEFYLEFYPFQFQRHYQRMMTLNENKTQSSPETPTDNTND